jgi:hypothetical protein
MKKKIKDLVEGDMVDLSSCPYLHDHPQAEWEYAEVVQIKVELPTCICVCYNIGEPSACGYDPDQEVYVKDN